jgi:hypothetical protein
MDIIYEKNIVFISAYPWGPLLVLDYEMQNLELK